MREGKTKPQQVQGVEKRIHWLWKEVGAILGKRRPEGREGAQEQGHAERRGQGGHAMKRVQCPYVEYNQGEAKQHGHQKATGK